MRLATIRTGIRTHAVRVDEHAAVELGVDTVEQFLARPGWRAAARAATGRTHPIEGLDYAPLVVAPEKVICVGLNYRNHILEMGRDLPTFPTLFAKYHRALIGAYDDITLPAASEAVDWEAELGVIVAAEVRNATPEQARAAIAGYTVVNDVTARDWQYHTTQWLQGKTFEATTPVGPWLTVADNEAIEGSGGGLALSCTLDGETVQAANTADLVFDPATLVSYISQVITLVPGDLIATGTPGGVGHTRSPQRYLADRNVLVTRIEGIGECYNRCVAEKTDQP